MLAAQTQSGVGAAVCVEEAKHKQRVLDHPVPKPKNREQFFVDYQRLEYEELAKIACSYQNIRVDCHHNTQEQSMKILVVSSYFQPAWDWGGPVRSMWNLARGLVSLGVDVTVLTTNAKQSGVVDIPEDRTEEGVLIITSPVLGKGRLSQANRHGISTGLWKNIVTNVGAADLVHINGFWGPTPAIAGVASLFSRKPYIISTRGNLQKKAISDKKVKKQVAFELGVKQILRSASALHYATLLEKKWSPGWAQIINSIIVPNPIEMKLPVDRDFFRKKHGIEPETLLIGIIGRIHRRKGFDIIIPALGKCASARKNIELVIVGPDEGYRNDLVQIITREGVEGKTKIVGELKGKELDEAFAGLDLLALPAHGENFGNVVVEAAIQGTPSIVSDQLGLMDWIKENDAGIVVPLDVDAWAKAIGEIDRAEIQCHWEPERLARIVRENFSIESVARQMLEQYEKILSGGKRRGRGKH